MAKLVLGPLLRYVGETEAVIWVETDEPCEVEVLGHTEPTFCVGGHHFGDRDRRRPRARLDEPIRGRARRRAPLARARLRVPAERDPHPRRRRAAAARASAPAGSRCRTTRPYTLPKDDHPDGREFDALYSLIEEMLRARPPSSGRRPCCCSATRSTPTRSRPRRSPSSASAATSASRRARRSPTSRSTRACTASRGRTRTIRWLLSTVSVSMVDRRPRHPRRLEHLRGLGRGHARARLVGRARVRRDRRLLALPVHRQPLARAAARERAARRACATPTTAGRCCASSPPTSAAMRDGARWSYCRDLGRHAADRARLADAAGCSTRASARCSTTENGSGWSSTCAATSTTC